MPRGRDVLDTAILQNRLWTPDMLPARPRILLETNKATVAGTTTATSCTTKGTLAPTLTPYASGTGLDIVNDPKAGGRVLRSPLGGEPGLAGAITAAAVDDQTFFCLRKRLAGGTTRGLFGYDWSVGGGYLLAWAFYDTISGAGSSGNLNWANGQVVWFSGSNNDGLVANTGQGNDVWFSSCAQAGINTPFYRENGTPQTITDSSSAQHAARTARPFVIGNSFDNTSSTEEWYGDIAVMGLWPTRFSLADVERLEGYYHWVYGMQALLPATHSCRNRPPLIGV